MIFNGLTQRSDIKKYFEIKTFKIHCDLIVDKYFSFLVLEGSVTIYKKGLVGFDLLRNVPPGDSFIYSLSVKNQEIKADSRIKAEVSTNNSLVLVQIKDITNQEEENKNKMFKDPIGMVIDRDDINENKYILKEQSIFNTTIELILDKIKNMESRSSTCNEILKNFLHKNYHNPKVKEDLDCKLNKNMYYHIEADGNLIKEENIINDINSLSNNHSYNSTNGAFEKPREKKSSNKINNKINLAKSRVFIYNPYSDIALSHYDEMKKKYMYPSNEEILRYILLRDFIMQFETLGSQIKTIIDRKFTTKLHKRKPGGNSYTYINIKESIKTDQKFKDKITSKLIRNLGIAEKIKKMKSNEALIVQNKLTFKKEEKILQESFYCFKCRETPRNAISTCGHLMLCEFCIQNMKICPKCGIDIGQVSKIYRS